MSEIPQPSAHDRKAQELDWRALADHLEKQGFHEQAEEMRASGAAAEAKSQQVNDFSVEKLIAENKKEIDQRIAAQRNISPPVHNPRFDAKKLDTHTLEAIKNMLQPANQNRPPSVPNAPKGPTPSGGK